jgi:hypothetical protein
MAAKKTRIYALHYSFYALNHLKSIYKMANSHADSAFKLHTHI